MDTTAGAQKEQGTMSWHSRVWQQDLLVVLQSLVDPCPGVLAGEVEEVAVCVRAEESNVWCLNLWTCIFKMHQWGQKESGRGPNSRHLRKLNLYQGLARRMLKDLWQTKTCSHDWPLKKPLIMLANIWLRNTTFIFQIYLFNKSWILRKIKTYKILK